MTQTQLSNPLARRPSVFRRIMRLRVGLVSAALTLLAMFAILHLLGFRDDTAIISGTYSTPSPRLSEMRGVFYALTYFAALLIAPILLLAAGLRAILFKTPAKADRILL